MVWEVICTAANKYDLYQIAKPLLTRFENSNPVVIWVHSLALILRNSD